MKTTQREVGGFEVTSGKLLVTDPCYERGTWCAGVLDKVKTGKWEGRVVISDEGQWGKRVAELVIHHTDHTLSPEDIKTRTKIGVGVDSGQAGFFCDSVYPANKAEQGDFDDEDSFYGKVCAVTLSDAQAGAVFGKGVVSRSGFGDGGYSCYTKRERTGKREIVGAKIVFITARESEG